MRPTIYTYPHHNPPPPSSSSSSSSSGNPSTYPRALGPPNPGSPTGLCVWRNNQALQGRIQRLMRAGGGVTAGVTACSKLPRPSGGCSIYKIYIFLWHPGGGGYRHPTPTPPGYGPAGEDFVRTLTSGALLGVPLDRLDIHRSIVCGPRPTVTGWRAGRNRGVETHRRNSQEHLGLTEDSGEKSFVGLVL